MAEQSASAPTAATVDMSPSTIAAWLDTPTAQLDPSPWASMMGDNDDM